MAEPGTQRWRGWVLAGGLFGCLALFVSYGIEWVEQEIDLGYGEEARRDRFLAASVFLQAQGIPSEAAQGLSLLDALPATGDTIVMSTSRRTLGERRLANLREWVVGGGHLVVAAEEVFDPEQQESRDHFLDALGIHLHDPDDEAADAANDVDEPVVLAGDADAGDERAAEHELDEDDEDGPRALGELLAETLSGELSECVSDEAQLAYMLVEGVPGLLELELSSPNYLSTQDGAGLEAASRAGAQLVGVRLGSGRVTAATSLQLWTNSRIHCHDHAYLLWRFSRDSSKVWMLHDPSMPGLGNLLAASFPLSGIGCAALLLVWAGSRTLRFGPQRILEVGQRRELLEHLQATADFGWRGGLLDVPLEAMREDVRARARRVFGALPQARHPSAARIAKMAQLPEADVEFALAGDSLLRKRDFVRTMQVLASIRRHL